MAVRAEKGEGLVRWKNGAPIRIYVVVDNRDGRCNMFNRLREARDFKETIANKRDPLVVIRAYVQGNVQATP